MEIKELKQLNDLEIRGINGVLDRAEKAAKSGRIARPIAESDDRANTDKVTLYFYPHSEKGERAELSVEKSIFVETLLQRYGQTAMYFLRIGSVFPSYSTGVQLAFLNDGPVSRWSYRAMTGGRS
jgi:hypothetical protein